MFLEEIIKEKELSIEKADQYNAEVYAKALSKIIELAQKNGLQICFSSDDGFSVINTTAYNLLNQRLDPFAKCTVNDIYKNIVYAI